MSTPAPVTEAHLLLAEQLIQDTKLSSIAQLIADSEALANAELHAEVERLREWQAGVIANERLHHAERKDAIARAEKAESELANIRALADRRNKSDHSQDTTHQLVAALDQALDIAQAELAATKSTLDEEVNCAEKAEHEVVRQYARAERAEAELAKAKAVLASIEEDGTEEHNAAVRLRQELASERARLDWLMAGGVCLVQHSGGFHVSRLHAQVSRAIIDAAMKEGA